MSAQVLSPGQVAATLGVDDSTVRRWVRAEVKSAAKDGQRWLYARTVAKAAPKPAPTPEPKPSPVAAVPPPSPIHDDGTHAHQCDTCGDAFRTNTRLRQHQANAHKAS